jgi:tetratricopeptide (TPR) repeat protein
MRARSALASLVLLGLWSCVGAGSKHYKTAEKHRTDGELAEARADYEEAVQAEPNNKKYTAALEDLRTKIDLEVDRLVSEAKAKEKAGDWSGASAIYAKAVALRPKDAELLARQKLSGAKGENLDPPAWYARVQQIAKDLPGNELVQKSLAGAKAAAYQYHLKLANDLLTQNEGPKAWKEYQKAQEVDSTMPGVDKERFDTAAALDLLEQGDAREKAGDGVGAYELYKKAQDRRNLPEIAKRLARTKAAASALLSKIEAARQKAEQGRWAEALRLYEGLSGQKGLPPSVEAEAQKARAEVSRASAAEAQGAADKGDPRRAAVALSEALRTAELSKELAARLKAGLEEAAKGWPGKARKALDAAGAPDGPFLTAARAYLKAAAKAAFDKAKERSKKDPSGAQTVLNDLEPFASELPELGTMKKSLVGASFQDLLDEALRKAKAGDDAEAAGLLLTALNNSQAPANMRAPTELGCDKLKAKAYHEAERAFQQALGEAPKSKLAQRAIDIARLRCGAAEKEAVEKLKSGKGEAEAAVAVLEAGLKAQPGNEEAKAGEELLLARLSVSGASLDDLKLAALLGQAARLVDLPAGARSAFEEGNGQLAQGNYAEAERSLGKAVQAAPAAKVLSLARDYSGRRKLAALTSGAKKAGAGDEGSAKALAQLLKDDPKNAEGHAALDALFKKAEAAAKAGNEGEAARLLGLLAIATDPPPGVKAALDKANTALLGGKAAEAEKGYGEALDLESEQPVAKLGLSIVKRARVDSLKHAVADAESGKDFEAAKEALKKTLELDPSSPEARKAFADLLEKAKQNGALGKDREAAELLEIANVVSKPDTAKQAIAAADQLLGEGKHGDAEAAYQKVLGGGDSQVAAAGKAIAHDRILQVLLQGVAELRKGGDLDRGAKATAELLKLDAASAEAHAAIDATLERAERAAGAGDDSGAARQLKAAAIASGAMNALQQAILQYESGKYEESAESFAKESGDVASRAAKLAKGRKLGQLKAGMAAGSDDNKAAESIRALLAADPTNKEALKAFLALLEKAKSAAKKLDDKLAADALGAAVIASGAGEEVAAPLKTGVTHLGEGRHAEAEKAFLTALELAKDSKVAKAGVEIAHSERQIDEKSAQAAIQRGDDPRNHAKVLRASLILEPKSPAVAKALADLVARLKHPKNDADAIHAIEAAAMLEGLPEESEKALVQGAVKLGEGKLEEAEAAFAGVENSKAAGAAKEHARARRIVALRAELTEADKAGDPVRASQAAQKVLELDPKDAAAKTASKKLGAQVVEHHIAAALSAKAAGKPGAAYVYLHRALSAAPENSKAKSEAAALEKELKARLDLVALVTPVARAPDAGSGCAGFEKVLREAIMTEGSSKKDLGAYVLSPDWSEAVEKKDKDAPKVTGTLEATIKACQNGSATGKIELLFALRAPPDKGRAVTEGTIAVELPSGLIPRDEQDGEGENAKKALAKRTAAALIEKLGEERRALEQWPLTVAEHGVEIKDVQLAADGYARTLVARPRSIDPKRAEAVEKYLAAELR